MFQASWCRYGEGAWLSLSGRIKRRYRICTVLWSGGIFLLKFLLFQRLTTVPKKHPDDVNKKMMRLCYKYSSSFFFFFKWQTDFLFQFTVGVTFIPGRCFFFVCVHMSLFFVLLFVVISYLQTAKSELTSHTLGNPSGPDLVIPSPGWRRSGPGREKRRFLGAGNRMS